ncbi:MAG: hypothetical protein MJ252_16845 [archaeon]|nr:hypothetical protein [archaeon]
MSKSKFSESLSEAQIKNFNEFFQKYSSDKKTLSCDQFRKTLGILGTKAGNWVSQRIYDVIRENSPKLSYEQYLEFLSLMNCGQANDKLTHSFKIFDQENKGYITAENYIEVMIKICNFISCFTVSQTTSDRHQLAETFKFFLDKENLTQMSLDDFIRITKKYPNFLDFYDIYHGIKNNENEGENTPSPFKKETLNSLKDLLGNIADLIDYVRTAFNKTSNFITLATTNSMKEFMELRQRAEGNQMQALSSSARNLWRMEKKQKPYMDLSPLELMNKKTGDDSLDFGMSDEEESSIKETEKDNSEEDEEEQKIKTNPIQEKINFDFSFIQPSKMEDDYLTKNLKDAGIDLDDCLIICGKQKFLSYFHGMYEKIIGVLNDIQPKGRRKNVLVESDILNNLRFNWNECSKNVFKDKEGTKGRIHFGNPNLSLVINIMMGIKQSMMQIDKITNSLNTIKLKGNFTMFPMDCDDVYKELNRYIYEQSNFEKPISCKFYDFAPKMFYNIRKMYGISNDSYLKSLGPENFLGNLIITKNKSLRELCSSGKSGSFFYFSYDSKYLLKTLPLSEFELLQGMLKDYYIHMNKYEDTLMQRFYGMHEFIYNDVKMYFVVLNNVFITPLKIHYQYDLKGSTYQRTSKKNGVWEPGVAMKDNDFEERKEDIDIAEDLKKALSKQAILDSRFLAKHNINDYSFLIGIHDLKEEEKENKDKETSQMLYELLKKGTSKDNALEKIGRKPFYEEDLGGMVNLNKNKVFFFGVIDILTNYGARKKFEHFAKSITQGSGISCYPPEDYSLSKTNLN